MIIQKIKDFFIRIWDWIKKQWKKIITIFIIGTALAAGDILIPDKITSQDLIDKYNRAPQAIKQKYSLEGSSFNMMAKDDWKDRIVVKIGDEGAEFKPKMRIERWDNEVNFSVELKDNQSGNASLSFKDDKIVWKKGKIEVNFYDLPDLDEGGQEFEVILKEKPLTNKIEFTLQDKDVEYFYQPPLTQQEIDEGAIRPENVVGSYAVYAKTPKTNWTGGKLYKTGKVGHIYRPKIIDSAGTEVWGDLHIENGLLTITIPQEFLDKAVYPVIVDPTFGYTSEGKTGPVANYVDYAYFVKGSPANGNGLVDIIKVYGGKWSSYGGSDYGVKPVIWLVADKTIISNGVAPEVNLDNASAQWWTSTYVTKPSVVNGTDYYVGIVTEENNSTGQYNDTGSAGDGGRSYNNYGTPANLGTISNNTIKWSIYATYTATGAAAAPPTRRFFLTD